LKKELTTAPVLVMPDMEKPFLINCNATRIWMCAYARWARGSLSFMSVKEA
jgi:hypothetical protein